MAAEAKSGGADKGDESIEPAETPASSTAEAFIGIPKENGDLSSLANGSMNGHDSSKAQSRPVIPAEEEAFLRSLGWEECDDENEGELQYLSLSSVVLSVASFCCCGGT